MQVHARATTYMATKTFIIQQSWKTNTMALFTMHVFKLVVKEAKEYFMFQKGK